MVHKLINSIVIEFCRLRFQPLIHACLQFRVVVEALSCEPGLHVWKQVVVTRRKIRTVQRTIKQLPSKVIQELSSAIVMKKQNLGTQFSQTLVLNRSSELFHCFTISLRVYCWTTFWEIHQKHTLPVPKNGHHDLSCWQSLQTFPWSFGRTCVSPLHRLVFWSHKSHVLPKSRPQLRHDWEVSHHFSRRPREMSTMLPCAVFCDLLTRVSVPIWHKIYGSLAFPSQSHATNFVKFEETQARTP